LILQDHLFTPPPSRCSTIRRSPSSMSQETTSPLTQVRVTRRGAGRRRDASRRSSTTTVMHHLFSPRDDNDDDDSSSKKKTVNQNYSFDYSRIPYNSNVHLLSIPLGKPPHFYGEDYSFWSHKMSSHLFSLHPSIWEIV
jgi:hypothetical protein